MADKRDGLEKSINFVVFFNISGLRVSGFDSHRTKRNGCNIVSINFNLKTSLKRMSCNLK